MHQESNDEVVLLFHLGVESAETQTQYPAFPNIHPKIIISTVVLESFCATCTTLQTNLSFHRGASNIVSER